MRRIGTRRRSTVLCLRVPWRSILRRILSLWSVTAITHLQVLPRVSLLRRWRQLRLSLVHRMNVGVSARYREILLMSTRFLVRLLKETSFMFGDRRETLRFVICSLVSPPIIVLAAPRLTKLSFILTLVIHLPLVRIQC